MSGLAPDARSGRLLDRPLERGGLRAKIGGLITWRWKVGSNTKLGRWPVIVNCGISGPRRFTLRVVR